MHLFDVDVADNMRSYRESSSCMPGVEPVICDSPWGGIGLSVCYDLRFPELYRAMAARGAKLFVLPAAFTAATGQAHWELLIRARAVENQCFVVASAQGGEHQNGRQTWGHSMIVDPWGTVLDCWAEGEGIALARLDFSEQQRLRDEFPALAHRRL